MRPTPPGGPPGTPPLPVDSSGADRRRAVVLWLAITLGVGFLLFLYRYLAKLADGDYSAPPLHPLITEMTAAIGGGLLFIPLRWFVLRHPLSPGSRLARLPAYALVSLVFSFALTSFMWATRAMLFPLAGLGAYEYGKMPLRYFMELPFQLVGFYVMVGGIHAMRRLRIARERERQALQLEASLARAQLQNLRLQLQPHFLFNALNTVSSAMYEDPRAADEMLDRLSDLLRTSLRTTQTDEVPLATELATLDDYLAIMGARFGDRLAVRVDVDPGARAALVPSMLLQPLVENAIRHGNAEREGHGRIEISARRHDSSLVLAVEDDGPGAGSEREGVRAGLGLSLTAERLRLLYGDDHAITTDRGPGGFRVAVRLPYRVSTEAAP